MRSVRAYVELRTGPRLRYTEIIVTDQQQGSAARDIRAKRQTFNFLYGRQTRCNQGSLDIKVKLLETGVTPTGSALLPARLMAETSVAPVISIL